MAKVFDCIDEKIATWIGKQKLFFVATAPLTGEGLVNCSPKGGDTLRVLDDHTLMYLEYAGSGVETIAHIRENKRMVIMMCAFEGPPKIYRFHGEGAVVSRNDPEFDRLLTHYDLDLRGVRSIIKLNVKRVSDSCGYGVPWYDYKGERPSRQNYIDGVDDTHMRAGLQALNKQSLDGLAGLTDEEIAAATPDAADET